MDLANLAHRYARKTFRSPTPTGEQNAYAIGFMTGYRLAIERVLWTGFVIAAIGAAVAWLSKIQV